VCRAAHAQQRVREDRILVADRKRLALATLPIQKNCVTVQKNFVLCAGHREKVRSFAATASRPST
jgi:hypothetical protein